MYGSVPVRCADRGRVGIFARRERREAEVDQSDEFVLGIADDVGGIDVAVDDAFVVDRLQCLAQLDRHRELLFERQVPVPDQVAQRRRLDVLEQNAAVRFRQLDRTYDIRARQRLVDREFVVITRDRIRAGARGLQRFDDDAAVALAAAVHDRARALVDALVDIEFDFSHGGALLRRSGRARRPIRG